MNFFIIEMIILSAVAVIILTFFFRAKQIRMQNGIDKRVHIENIYTKEIKKLTSKEEKVIYVKKCNSELSRNIFFTEKEANQLIEKLVSI